MPNWCENTVTFRMSLGNKDEFLAWACDLEDSGLYRLNFHRILPLNLGSNEDGSPTWDYNTACEKWGTKWDVGEATLSVAATNSHAYLGGVFDTAWAPPNGIYNAIQEKIESEGWDVDIEEWFYKEPGMRIAGWLPD